MTKPLVGLVSAMELTGDCVFGHVLTGWSKARAQIDRLMVVEEPEELGNTAKEGAKIVLAIRFGLHDVRRTVRTRMAEAADSGLGGGGLPGHQAQSSLALTYNRYDPIKEKREALSKWADYLAAVLTK